ncbi:MAG: DUF2849 domain-containing protein [Pseudomonadota bacterium]|nr:DUF2849 domain-containing protein [Pseudomonadota bacterium]
MSLQAVTANRLGDGLVIYLTATGWSEQVADAATADTRDAAQALLDRALAQPGHAVGAELIEVEQGADGLRPVRYRELIRSLGPTVRADLGYQAA